MSRQDETRRKTNLATHRFVLLAVLMLAWGLRLWGLADHNIWWDEGWSAWVARQDVGRINHIAATGVHPPLYLLGLRAWWGVVGEGEFLLRFPSAVYGLLAVAAIYGLGRSLGGRRTGLLAALLLAVSRFAITWSQEMRMYILAALLATLALWAAVRYWRTGGRRAWLAYVLTMAAGLWTHYLYVSTLAVVNLAWLVAWWRSTAPVSKGRFAALKERLAGGRRCLVPSSTLRSGTGLDIGWAAAQVAVLVLFTPWLVYALPRIRTQNLGQLISPAIFIQFYFTLLATGVPLDIERYALGVSLVIIVLLTGMVALWLDRRRAGRWDATAEAGAVALISGFLLPAAIVYAVLLPFDFFYTPPLEPRYLLVLSSCFYVLLAWGIIALARQRRWLGWVSAGLVLVVALAGLVDFYPGRARRDDYASLSMTLQAFVHSGDAVVLQDDTDWPIFAGHYPGYWHGVPNGRPSDPASVEAFLAPIWAESEGVWLVLTLYARQSDPEGQMQRWLAERALSETVYRYAESELHFYPRTPQRAATANELAPDYTIGRPLEAEVAPGLHLVGAEVALPTYQAGDTLYLFLYWEGTTAPAELALVNEDGQAVRTMPITPPPGPGRRRQQVDLPLTADLDRGRYTVRLNGQDIARLGLLATRKTSGSDQVIISHSLDLGFADPARDRRGELIRLLGYDLTDREVQPGETVDLTLYWSAPAPVTVRYKVFTHVLGNQVNPVTGSILWGQHDAEPDNFTRPTTTWIPGETVIDRHTIPIDASAPPGHYSVEIGLYDGLSGTRLAVYDEDGTPLGDHVILTEITIP